MHWKVLLILLSHSTLGIYENDTLIMVHVIFRHGEKYPDPSHLPGNSLFHERNKEKSGQLTWKGIHTSYELGVRLYNRYPKIFQNGYNPNLIEAISSDYIRTRMTLQLVLAGLFPPYSKEKIHEDLNWQPVYFDSIKKEDDYIIWPSASTCTEITFFQNEEFFQKNQKICELITDYLGHENLSMIGKLLEKILKDTKQIISMPNDPKAIIYSGHDINIILFLKVLRASINYTLIPYNSYLAVEIHETESIIGVKVYYKEPEGAEQLIKIEGCNEICPLSKFEEILGKYISDRWCDINH